MSHATAPADPHAGHHDHDHDEAHEHAHDPHLAHHFESHQQQFASAKLGMWSFLATEILMFGGLFCAYAVYRGNHPEIFQYAADPSRGYLDWTLGAINTIVLLASSLSMAWAVRNAQLNQRRALVINLCITLLGGFGFMGIKAVEYHHKWHDGLLWGKKYDDGAAERAKHDKSGHGGPEATTPATATPPAPVAPAAAAPVPAAPATPRTGPWKNLEDSNIKPASAPPAGLAKPVESSAHGYHGPEPKLVGRFFTVYFGMTGLHGVHVLVGMGLITWLLVRSLRGDFSSEYYTPVDFVGLYWHLVDLIWIFLFPLLYLIH